MTSVMRTFSTDSITIIRKTNLTWALNGFIIHLVFLILPAIPITFFQIWRNGLAKRDFTPTTKLALKQTTQPQQI